AIPVPLMSPSEVPVKPAPTPPATPLLDVALPNEKEVSPPQTPLASTQQAPTSSPVEIPVATPAPSAAADSDASKHIEPFKTTEEATSVEKMGTPVAPAVTPFKTAVPAPRPVTSHAAVAAKPYKGQDARFLQVSVFNDDREAFACLNNIQTAVPGAAILRA